MNIFCDPVAGRITRRASLLGLTTALSLGRASMAVAAAPTERRFVVVILRGALDGLSAVVPYGDPDLAALRPRLLPPMPGQERGLLDLGGTFGLHPALAASHAMYRMGQLRIVHAVAADYRVRSHFEAQDYLESGADHRLNSGWLNRVAASIRAPSVAKLYNASPPKCSPTDRRNGSWWNSASKGLTDSTPNILLSEPPECR